MPNASAAQRHVQPADAIEGSPRVADAAADSAPPSSKPERNASILLAEAELNMAAAWNEGADPAVREELISRARALLDEEASASDGGTDPLVRFRRTTLALAMIELEDLAANPEIPDDVDLYREREDLAAAEAEIALAHRETLGQLRLDQADPQRYAADPQRRSRAKGAAGVLARARRRLTLAEFEALSMRSDRLWDLSRVVHDEVMLCGAEYKGLDAIAKAWEKGDKARIPEALEALRSTETDDLGSWQKAFIVVLAESLEEAAEIEGNGAIGWAARYRVRQAERAVRDAHDIARLAEDGTNPGEVGEARSAIAKARAALAELPRDVLETRRQRAEEHLAMIEEHLDRSQSSIVVAARERCSLPGRSVLGVVLSALLPDPGDAVLGIIEGATIDLETLAEMAKEAGYPVGRSLEQIQHRLAAALELRRRELSVRGPA